MHPPDKQNGPGSTTSQGRNETDAHQTQALSRATVQPETDSRHALSANALDRVPAAFASVYAPAPGRTRWLAVFICPHCRLGHAGYAREAEKIPGMRRSRCGKRVRIVVARVYRGQHSEVAA
ncbi:hypothetical protein FHU36_000293 [Nonomuraea muscovyensis]|uniref:Uncharacterized protein n=1 Tax=Nonomuraea muscovyensis TaxID=1124761 RepID=A0A7X0BZC3_9ACTN|nr:hypothetical protein [Nonomuraea muscovyensis]MBB6343784.1 hypothetical protein [Nonomuraea muscovyensis]